MKCPKCGAENDESVISCSMCSASFKETPPTDTSHSSGDATQLGQQQIEELRKTSHYVCAKELILSGKTSTIVVIKKLIDDGVDESIAYEMVKDIERSTEKNQQPDTKRLKSTYYYTYAKELISSSHLTKTQAMQKLTAMGIDEHIADSIIKKVDKEMLADTFVKGKGASSASASKPSRKKILVVVVLLVIAAAGAAGVIIYRKGKSASDKAKLMEQESVPNELENEKIEEKQAVEQEEVKSPPQLAVETKVAEEMTAEKFLKQGNAKYRAGDYKGAKYSFDRAIAMNPNYVDAYYNRADARFMLGDRKDALDDCDKVISFNPKNADMYLWRGKMRSSAGKKRTALNDFDKAIELNPNYAEAYIERGRAKEKLKDYEGAKEDFEKGKRLETPSNVKVEEQK